MFGKVEFEKLGRGVKVKKFSFSLVLFGLYIVFHSKLGWKNLQNDRMPVVAAPFSFRSVILLSLPSTP